MSKTVLNLLTTFDGYVAGAHDEIDWIGGNYPPSDNPDIKHVAPKAWDFSEFTSQVGAIIVGKRSYDMGIEKGWFKDQAYGPSPIFVVCEAAPAEASKDADFRFVTQGVHEAHRQAEAAAGDKLIYIFGGPSIFQQLFNEDLVDELRISVAPLILGKGIRLFDNLTERRVLLQQLKVQAHPNSMYEIHYRVVR